MKLLTSLNSGSTDYPTFSAGWPVLKLVIRQCLGVKGIGVEIVSLCFFSNCSFYQNQLISCLNDSTISPKKWSYCSKAKFISLYIVVIFYFTPVLRHMEWTFFKRLERLRNNWATPMQKCVPTLVIKKINAHIPNTYAHWRISKNIFNFVIFLKSKMTYHRHACVKFMGLG